MYSPIPSNKEKDSPEPLWGSWLAKRQSNKLTEEIEIEASKTSPYFESKSPDQLFSGRHVDLLEAVSPVKECMIINSEAKSLETITEQATYLEIDFFSANKT